MAWTLAQYQAALKTATDESARLNSLSSSTKEESSAALAAKDKAVAKELETRNIVNDAGYNLKWSQIEESKQAAANAKQAVDKSDIAAKQAANAKAAYRDSQYNVVSTQYSKPNPFPYRAGGKGRSYNNDSFINWNESNSKSKADAEAAIRMSHLAEDGWKAASVNRGGFIPYPTNPTARKLYTGEAINQTSSSALRNNTPLSQIGNRWTRYQVEISRANKAVYAGGSLSAHASAVQAAKNTFDGLEKQEQLRNSAKARAASVGQLNQDRKKWNEVIVNPTTYQNNLTGASIMNVKQAPVKSSPSSLSLSGMGFSKNDAPVGAAERSQIENTIQKQRAQQEINREQQEYFNAIRNAPNAAAALKLRSANMAQNPNVGTYNALFRGDKLQSTSGVFGIGDGTVKDLNYKKFDRASQTFAENPKLGDLTDSQGNVIASNLKSSEGVEWNFSPVPAKEESRKEEKTIKGVALPYSAAGFLGGLSIFSQAPNTSSNAASIQTAAAVPTYEISLANYNADSAAFDSFWKANPPATYAQYDQYVAEFDALNLQYENLSDEFEAREKEDEEWGGYMPEDQGWYSYVQNEIRPKDMPRDELGNVNDPVTGSVVKVGWNVIAAINNLGVYGAKTLEPEKYKNEEYLKYYSTPVTNVESAGFGAAIGTATQGADFWTGGSGTQLIDNEKKQIGKNFERNWQEAGLTTVLEGAMYPITGTAKLIQKGATKLGGLLGDTAESTAKGAAKGAASSAPSVPNPKFTAAEVAQAKKDWNVFQQGNSNLSQAKQEKILKILQSADAKKYPKDPTPSELKLYDDIINTKIKKVPKYEAPTIFKNIGKVADDLPIIKTNDLPVKPKDSNLPKKPNDLGFPVRISDLPPTRRPPKAPTAPTPKSKKGFVLPFGWPKFSGRSGGGGVGNKGKRQSRKKFTAWDVRQDKIGFYGFGRKSDSYGGVFGELDKLDKAAKAEKKTKSKEKKSGFDEVFNFSFDF